jgi:hypothetical protein
MSKEIPDDFFEVSHTDSNECDNEALAEALRMIRDWKRAASFGARSAPTPE